MTRIKSMAGVAKARLVRASGTTVAAALRSRKPKQYRSGCTVITVNWNSLPFLKRTLSAIEAMSPVGTEVVVVDNASTDGSRPYLKEHPQVRTRHLPVNAGHGMALDLAIPTIDTEYVAILDVDAFPVSDQWLQRSIAALNGGAQAAGARLQRNFVHPSFFVARTKVLHDYSLTFKPVGSLARLKTSAPLFLDVGEALSQRLIIKFGGGSALHFFEATSTRGPGLAGSVFGGLVYHNLYATQGVGKGGALQMFEEEFRRYHLDLGILGEAPPAGQ